MSACKACGGNARGLYCGACNERAKASGGERPYTGARKRATAHRNTEPRTEGLDSLSFTLYGAPRTKKTHNRLVRHAGRHKVLPSAAWIAWRDALSLSGQVKPWMRLKDQPYNCAALFYRDARRGDATGYYQGLADVLEHLGVVSNDQCLETWNGSKQRVDRENPRVEITLTPLTR